MVKASLGNCYVGRHCTIRAISEASPRWIEIIIPSTGKGRVLIDDRGCLADYAITFAEAENLISCSGYCATEFVSEYTGVIHLPAVLSLPLMYIASTQA